jgi:XTP/dITP diphosphohydrolase
MRLVLGSRNKKKLKEMVALLGDLPLELTDLSPYPDAPEVDETADTFVGNAILKASQLAPALGTWVIGEDSGLCVPALGGAPGVYSARYARSAPSTRPARYAGAHGNDEANNDKLLREMAALTGDARAAYYVSTAVLANPRGEVIARVEGRCHGVIVEARRGAGGFGYDPLFLVPEFGRTFGELPPEVKAQMSHRAKAFAELRPIIERELLTERGA